MLGQVWHSKCKEDRTAVCEVTTWDCPKRCRLHIMLLHSRLEVTDQQNIGKREACVRMKSELQGEKWTVKRQKGKGGMEHTIEADGWTD